MKITIDWFRKYAVRDKAGWNPEQLSVLGVNPTGGKGWLVKLIGKSCSAEQREAFECWPRPSISPLSKGELRTKKRASRRGKQLARLHAGRFFRSQSWYKARYRAIVLQGGKCQCCGVSAIHGAVMHVDHILPRSKFPELSLDVANLQVLCEACNVGKSNKDYTDWRDSLALPDDAESHMSSLKIKPS